MSKKVKTVKFNYCNYFKLTSIMLTIVALVLLLSKAIDEFVVIYLFGFATLFFSASLFVKRNWFEFLFL